MATAALASDEDAVYLCDGAVTRIPKDGSAPTTIVGVDPVLGCGHGIVVTDDGIAWICGIQPDGGTAICGFRTGSASAGVIANSRPSIRAIAYYGGYLDWIEGDVGSQIVRARTDGTELDLFVPPGKFETGTSSGRIAADESGVYWLGQGAGALAGGSLFRVAHTGGDIQILDHAKAGERGITLSATEVVYVADAELRIVAKSGDRVRTLRSVPTMTGYFFSRGVGADAANVWIGINAGTGNQLLRVAREGTTTVVSKHPAMEYVVDVLADDDGVYEFAGGKLVAWPK